MSPLLFLLNAGSLMLWFGFLHLIIGNLFIAIFEYLFVTKVYRLNLKIWPVIIGNYVSMFISLFLIVPAVVSTVGNYNFWAGATYKGYYDFTGFAVGMATGLICMLLIELPFYFFAQKVRDKNNHIVRVSCVSNVISFLIIAIIYFLLNLPM